MADAARVVEDADERRSKEGTMASKCKHPPCTCDPMGKVYCSTHCATSEEFDELPTTCDCGHIACETSEKRPETQEERR
jgi:hypothetical protein